MIQIHSFVFKILNGNEIVMSTKGHNSVNKTFPFTIKKQTNKKLSSPLPMPIQLSSKFIYQSSQVREWKQIPDGTDGCTLAW